MDELLRNVKCEYIGADEVAERGYWVWEAYQRADGQSQAYNEIQRTIRRKLKESAEEPTSEQETFLSQISRWEREADREYERTADELLMYNRDGRAMVKITIKPKPLYEFYLRHRTWTHTGFDRRDCEALLVAAIAVRTKQIIPYHQLRHSNDLDDWMHPYEHGPIEYDAVVSGDFYVVANDEQAREIAAALSGEEA